MHTESNSEIQPSGIPMTLAMGTHDLQSDEATRSAYREPTAAKHTPELCLGQLGSHAALSTAIPEIDDAQPQADDAHLSTFVHNSHHYTSRTSRSPSTAPEAVPVAEYQEWLY
jgi:hypothetical protein